MEYSFQIVSTVETRDHSDQIDIGDNLYNVESPDCYSTEAEAESAGWAILNGLDGGGAYNLALETAEIIIIPNYDSRVYTADIYRRLHDALDSDDLALKISRLYGDMADTFHDDTGVKIGAALGWDKAPPT